MSCGPRIQAMRGPFVRGTPKSPHHEIKAAAKRPHQEVSCSTT